MHWRLPWGKFCVGPQSWVISFILSWCFLLWNSGIQQLCNKGKPQVLAQLLDHKPVSHLSLTLSSIPFLFSGIEKENIETILSQQTTYNVLYIITVQLNVIANGWYQQSNARGFLQTIQVLRHCYRALSLSTSCNIFTLYAASFDGLSNP